MDQPDNLQSALARMEPYLPWYRPWINGNGAAGEQVRSLQDLPLVTASILEAYYYAENNPLADRPELNCYRTSGTSSGIRKAIYYSEWDEEQYVRIKEDIFRAILGTGRYRTALADMGTGHAEATAVEVFRRLGMEVESISFRLPIQEHLAKLESFRPEVLYTMPSILNRIVLESPDPSSYGIRHVVLVGEIASRAWIRETARQLGLDPEQITDTYGSIEVGTIAYYSHEHGRYVLAEGLSAEGMGSEELGEGLEPLPDAQEKVLVLTSAVREAFPALRYVTYDVVRDLRPILVDGRWIPSFHSLVKRIGPDLKHGEKISIYDVETVVYRHLSEAGFRVKVTGNALTVAIASPLATDEVLHAIRHDLEHLIPEIGMMIQARLLDGIRVIRVKAEELTSGGSIKGKKLFYEQSGESSET
ncbi:CoF synthetase [Paenibacillus sp. CC-CFT747]|nr:CoF synthetase [Paenibacillus sp. CC-CFT747]